MRNKIGTLALTFLMVAVGLATIAPSAAADHGCTPIMGVDNNHSPAGQWATHVHPRFTFPVHPIRCYELTTEVRESWRGSFTTSADDYHPHLGSGEFYVEARALVLVPYYGEVTWHCHEWDLWGTCLWWHWGAHIDGWREEWTGWVRSPTVKIDLIAPDVGIAGISGPFVQGPDADYLTNETTIALSASDAHSGVDRIEYRIDDGDWQVYTGSATITGEEGEHTFTYRAVDNVGHETVKSRDFILDNTIPAQTMIRPNDNSATYGDYAVETCNGALRVTEGGHELVAAPDVPEAAGNATAEADNHTPATPDNAEVVNDGPDWCAGDVVETNALSVPPEKSDPVLDEIDAARDALEAAVQELSEHLPTEEIEAYRNQLVQAAEDAWEQLPQDDIDAILSELPQEEIDAILSQLPDEPPEAPDNATVEGRDVDREPVYLVSGTVEIELDVLDELVGTANVSFLVDGVVHETQSNGDGVYVFQWDTAEVPTGAHAVTLQATDRLGNQGEWTFPTWVVSSTAPEPPDPEVPEPPEAPEVPELPA